MVFLKIDLCPSEFQQIDFNHFSPLQPFLDIFVLQAAQTIHTYIYTTCLYNASNKLIIYETAISEVNIL